MEEKPAEVEESILESRTPPNQELSEPALTVKSNMSFAPVHEERSEFSFRDGNDQQSSEVPTEKREEL